MPGEKFIQHDTNGGFSEVEATQAGGAGNENKLPSLDAAGRLDNSMMPTGIGADTQTLEASETIAAGSFVNVHDDGGAFKVRLADATTAGKEAHGFTKDSISNAATGTVYFEGNNDAVSGATPGVVYLSTTAGGFTSTAPTTSGNRVQKIGIATSATSINFERTNAITLA